MPGTTDDAVLELVRLALGTASCADGVDPIDVDVVTRAAQLGVVEQVIAAAAMVGFRDDAGKLAAAMTRSRAMRGVQAETMAWLVHRLLGDAGVPSLLLKGAALAAMTGREPGERAGVDTDVLIRPADWPRAHDALVAAGYALDNRCPAPLTHDSMTRFLAFANYEAAYGGPGGPVDVHWRLVPGHHKSLSAAALFERAVDVQLAGGAVGTLDPDAMLAHVALHGAKDGWRSARTLVDAYLLVMVAGATWVGAASLVGRSRVVSDAKAAVESDIARSSARRAHRFPTPPADEPLPSFLRRRAALTPTPASVAAVAAGMVLPRQLLVQSPVPRRAWWLMVAPRTGRAAWSGLCSVVERRQTAPARTATTTDTGSSSPRASTLQKARRDGSAVARDLKGWYAGTSSGSDTYRVARKVHVRTAGISSATLFAVMRAVPGASDRVRRDDVVRARHRSERALDDLRRAGMAVIDPVLDSDAVAQLRAFAERAPAKLRLADGRVIDGTYAERHPDTTLVSIPGAFAWAHGEVQHVMASERLHELALARFGLAPVVHLPSLYWSCVPSTPSARAAATFGRASFFHVDYDGIQAIRVHMYLTDVDAESAPMEYVLGSHRVGSQHGREFRRADDGLDEAVVSRRFGAAAIRAVTGSAGTTFVTDPRGLHRATSPEGHDRLFLVTAIRAGAFAGAYHRRRAVPVRDERFGRLLDDPRGPLRLFEAIAYGESSTLSAASVARLA